jgi:hypothetical protein
MDKKYRKQIEQQLAISIAYFLRKTDEKAAAACEKVIRSAAKEVAKKFVKFKMAEAAPKAEKPASADNKKPVKKTAKKAAKKAVKKVAAKKTAGPVKKK